MDTIKIYLNDKEVTVAKSDYVAAKTKDLREFGYTSLTENDVANQLEKILSGSDDLDVVGQFIKPDIADQ